MAKKQKPNTENVLDFIRDYIQEKFGWKIIPKNEGYLLKDKFHFSKNKYPGSIDYASPAVDKNVEYRIGFSARKNFEKNINELKKELEKKFSKIAINLEIKK